MTARPIIIDCDPGQDDAMALLLALASPELKVLGITTVAGNVPLVVHGHLSVRWKLQNMSMVPAALMVPTYLSHICHCRPNTGLIF